MPIMEPDNAQPEAAILLAYLCHLLVRHVRVESAGSQEQDRIAHGGPELLWVIEARQHERTEVAYVRVVG
jgi:hypothetical protein